MLGSQPAYSLLECRNAHVDSCAFAAAGQVASSELGTAAGALSSVARTLKSRFNCLPPAVWVVVDCLLHLQDSISA